MSTNYFGDKEEQAVIDYIKSDSIIEKNRIYNDILIEPFRKMTESILRVYPIFTGKYEMKEIESNALSHLIDKMVTFNPDKITKFGLKTKAFSYLQTIVRNYYRTFSTKTYLESKTDVFFDDYFEIDKKQTMTYQIDDDESFIIGDLIFNIVNKIEDRIDNDNTLKPLEKMVGEAIANILKDWNLLFLEDSPDGVYGKRITNKFTKNKILFYLKEQTNLSAKDIRLAIKPFKELYFNEKFNLLND